MLVDAICFALSGFFMKASDEFADEKDNTIMAIITGFLCVIFSLYVSHINGDATCIFISILIGTGLALKVDTINHIMSAIIFLLILFTIGFPQVSPFCLVLSIIAAYADERGNDYADEKENKGLELNFFEKLLKYRYIFKFTVLLLSLLGLIQYFNPNFLGNMMFFKPITIVYFYLFDLSYEFSNTLVDGFNDIFQRFLR